MASIVREDGSFSSCSDDFALPVCPWWKVIDRNDLSSLVDKLRYVLIGQEFPRDLLTKRGTDQLSVALSCRGLPRPLNTS
jgi:hypothetical protein